MKESNSNKNKHLTQEDRLEIQLCLDRGMTFKAIGSRVGKDQTTISKEVKKHIRSRAGSKAGCTDQHGNPITPAVCPKLLKAPFVCNPCKQRRYHCTYQKQLYIGKDAQREYELLLSEAREGIPLNKDEFYEVDKIITNGVKQGQHIYHIMQTNDIAVSKSTVYRHIKKGYLSICSMDLPRAPKFKVRKRRPADYVPRAAKVGRTYDDFLTFVDEQGISEWTEMDTVIGLAGGKAILTLDFTFCNFMAGILLEVEEKIKSLKSAFSAHGMKFGDIFPLLLTDNGGEFANILAIENDNNGEHETSLFFCDPYNSSQKPRVEKNHTLFRDIVPKGISFNSFTQKSVNIIFSNVNGVKRKIFNGKSPYDVFTFTFGKELADILGIGYVPPEQVIQSPKLLKMLPR